MMLLPALGALLGLCRVQSFLPSLNNPTYDDVQLKASSSELSELQLAQSKYALYDDVEVFSPEEKNRRQLAKRRELRGGLFGFVGGIASGIHKFVMKADWGDIVDVAGPFLGPFGGPIAGLGKIAQPILKFIGASPSERKKNGIFYFASSVGQMLQFAGSLTGGGMFNPLKLLGVGINVVSSNIMANGGRLPSGKEFAPFAFKVLRDFIIEINPFKDLIRAAEGVIATMDEVRRTGRLGLADLIAPALFIMEAGKIVFPHPVMFAITGAMKITRDLGVFKNDKLPTFRLPKAFGDRYQKKFGRKPKFSEVMLKAQGNLDASHTRLNKPSTMSSDQSLRQVERIRHNYNRRFNTRVNAVVRPGRRGAYNRIAKNVLAFNHRPRRTRRSRRGGAIHQMRNKFTGMVTRLLPGRMSAPLELAGEERCDNLNLDNDEDVEEDFHALDWRTIIEVFNNNLPGSEDYEAVAGDINDFLDRACAGGGERESPPEFEEPEMQDPDTTPLHSQFEDLPYEDVVGEGTLSAEEEAEIEAAEDPAIWLRGRHDDDYAPWIFNSPAPVRGRHDDDYAPWIFNSPAPVQGRHDDDYAPWIFNSPAPSSREEHFYDPSLYEGYDPTLSQEDEPEAEVPSPVASSGSAQGEDAPLQSGGDEMVQPAPIDAQAPESSQSEERERESPIDAEAPESHIGSLHTSHPHAPERSGAPVHSDDLPPAQEHTPVLAAEAPYDPALYQALSTAEKRLVQNVRYDLEFDQLFGFHVDFPHEHDQRRRRLMRKLTSPIVAKFGESGKVDEAEPEPPLLL